MNKKDDKNLEDDDFGYQKANSDEIIPDEDSEEYNRGDLQGEEEVEGADIKKERKKNFK